MKKIEIARALAAARGAAEGADAQDGDDAVDLGELTGLPGLGRKRARQLHHELGVRTLEELAAALLDGRVRALRGFSDDACERLRAGLQAHFARTQRFGLAEAELHVAPLIAYLRALPVVERVEVAGSVRRRRASVGDVDLLVVSSRPALVMRQFAAFADAARVEPTDASRGALVLRCGLRVDVRVVPRRCFGATLQFLTGSCTHNAQLRQLGLDHGFRISEYGVFSVDHARAGARRAGGQREEDVFAALGIEWVPPELREGRGEVELAARHALPRLVDPADVRGDLGILDGGRGRTDRLALIAACAAMQYEYCAVLECGAATGLRDDADGDECPDGVEADEGLPELHSGLRVFRGLAAGIAADGSLDADPDRLGRAELVVAGVRGHARQSRQRMTERILRAIEHPAVDILAWPGRVAGRRELCDLDLDEVLAAAAAHGVALELSAAADDGIELDDQLRRAAELGVVIAVSANARHPGGLARIRYALDQARRGWIEPPALLNARDAVELEEWLRRRQPRRAAVLAGSG